ncbi:MAG: N-acetylmuramoyl-L-alanine amidase [Ruminococcaceae bacterium]|nr:N-acetylmuramoyl-L-alanine amidase [Oscillospiraceae bacterium]
MAIKVYIDQGHNPQNPNAGAEGNGYREQDIVYRIGQELYRLLYEDPNYIPRLSRPTPQTQLGNSVSSSLRERVDQANSFGANLLLSLHTNASTNASASGTEALVFRNGSVAYDIATVLLREISLVTGLRNRGIVLRPRLYILRRTRMPAVLLELGFITNPEDADLMYNNPRLFALAIYRGLNEYYGF